MKKSFFAVMLSAAFVTTTPLFGMDAPENGEKKVISHQHCSSCSCFDVETEENGDFNPMPYEITVQIIEQADLSTVIAISGASKMMYNLCQMASIWKSIAKKHNASINPSLCIKEQFKTSFLLFSDPSKKYNLPLKRFLSSVDYTSKNSLEEGHDRYSLMLWKRFNLDYTGFGLDLLHDVTDDSSLTFSYDSATKMFVCMSYEQCLMGGYLLRLKADSPTRGMLQDYNLEAGEWIAHDFRIASSAE